MNQRKLALALLVPTLFLVQGGVLHAETQYWSGVYSDWKGDAARENGLRSQGSLTVFADSWTGVSLAHANADGDLQARLGDRHFNLVRGGTSGYVWSRDGSVSGSGSAYITIGDRVSLGGGLPDIDVRRTFTIFDGTFTTSQEFTRNYNIPIYAAAWNYWLGPIPVMVRIKCDVSLSLSAGFQIVSDPSWGFRPHLTPEGTVSVMVRGGFGFSYCWDIWDSIPGLPNDICFSAFAGLELTGSLQVRLSVAARATLTYWRVLARARVFANLRLNLVLELTIIWNLVNETLNLVDAAIPVWEGNLLDIDSVP